MYIYIYIYMKSIAKDKVSLLFYSFRTFRKMLPRPYPLRLRQAGLGWARPKSSKDINCIRFRAWLPIVCSLYRRGRPSCVLHKGVAAPFWFYEQMSCVGVLWKSKFTATRKGVFDSASLKIDLLDAQII